MREMKDSGIEWIGEIPKEWTVIKNKYVSKQFTGNSIKDDEKSNYIDFTDAIAYISSKDIDIQNNAVNYNNGMYIKKGDCSFKVAHVGDILMCIEGGSAGRKKAYLRQNVCFVNKLCCFHPININSKFLYYVLNSPHYEAEFNFNISGMIGGVTKSKLNNFVIPLPSNVMQQKIANYLDRKCEKIDDMIAKEQEEIDKLNEYKDSLIEITITKGLNKKADIVKSELKWIDGIPKHWKKYKLSQLCSSKKYSMVDGPFGSDMKNEEYVDEGVPIIQLTNIKKYNHYTEKLKFITRDKHEQLKRHTAQKGDIAIAKMMPAGRECILSDLYDEYVVAADAIRFSPDKTKVDKRFVLYCLNTYGMVESELESKGTTRIRISLDIARNIKLYLPKLEEQTDIADFLDKKCNEIEKTIKLKEIKIEKIEAYKKSLIYECVTGKKEV